MAENVCVAVIGQDAEVYGFATTPFLDRFDKENDIAQPKLDQVIVSIATGITFDTDLHDVFQVTVKHGRNGSNGAGTCCHS
jgi:hypothetical protein